MIIKKTKILLTLRRTSLICLFLSLLFNIMGVLTRLPLLPIIGVTFFIVFIVISFLFWNCPYCKKRLPMKFNLNDNDFINDKDSSYCCPHCMERIY